MYRLHTLGALDLRGTDGHPVQSLLSQPKRCAVLCYLAVAIPSGYQRRDRLAALFWPEHDADHARHSLRQALHAIRRSLGEDAIETRGDEEVALSPTHVWCDAAELERAFAEQRWGDVVELHHGDLLEGYYVPESVEFEQWLDEQRARLRGRARTAAWKCVEACVAQGDAGGALAWGRRALELAPADEEPVRRFLQLAASLGERAAGLQAYESFVQRLRAEYELEPSAETTALARALKSAQPAPVPHSPGSLPAAAALAPSAAASRTAPRRARRLVLVVAGAVALLGLSALLRASRAPLPEGPVALAVLPFATDSGAAEEQRIADGLTEAVTRNLRMIPQLQVILPRTATADTGGLERLRVADALAVTHLVIGSMSLRENGSLQVRVEVVDPRSREAFLSREYGGREADLFSIDDHVAHDIAAALGIRLPRGVRARLGTAPTGSTRAYELYQRGRYFLNEWNEATIDSAIAAFEAAVAEDPAFALARARLSDAYCEKSELFDPDGAWRQKAYVAAQTALKLDPQLAEGYVARGNYLWNDYNHFPHEAALRDFMLAADLQPSLSTAHDRLSLIYGHICLFDEALDEGRIAVMLDPGDYWARFRVAYALTMKQDYPAALRELRGFPPRVAPMLIGSMTVESLLYLDRTAEALALSARLVDGYPDDPWVRGVRALALAATGDSPGTLAEIAAAVPLMPGRTHNHHSQFLISLALAGLGHHEEAVDWLEQAARNGFPCYPRFLAEPRFAPLREHPRFMALMRELEAEWLGYRRKFSRADSGH